MRVRGRSRRVETRCTIFPVALVLFVRLHTCVGRVDIFRIAEITKLKEHSVLRYRSLKKIVPCTRAWSCAGDLALRGRLPC